MTAYTEERGRNENAHGIIKKNYTRRRGFPVGAQAAGLCYSLCRRKRDWGSFLINLSIKRNTARGVGNMKCKSLSLLPISKQWPVGQGEVDMDQKAISVTGRGGL
jgi:hypothetical protein